MPKIVSLKKAGKLLKNGAVGVIPTDTVYGIVTTASSPETVARLFDTKKRDGKPGTIIGSSIGQFVELGLKQRYIKPMAHHWPAPLSVVAPCVFGTLEYLHQGQGSLAIRIPDNGDLLQMLEVSGPLMTSSANHPGQPTATNISEAINYFGDTVDFYVDGGELKNSQPSTVVRVDDDEITVLRRGAYEL
jgi:L-threonylcarbamoyladenylate synthase